MEQRTKEWLAARLGKLTASSMGDAMEFTAKGLSGAKRTKLIKKVAWERINGFAADTFVNQAMRWGVEQEAAARLSYEMATGIAVKEVGFVDHPTIPFLGASPDGFAADGLVELKCPTEGTHCDYIIGGVVPEDRKPQMILQLACTGRKWCDFVSYDPRCIPAYEIFIRRYTPTEQETKTVLDFAVKFLAEVEELVLAILKTKPVEARNG